MPSGEEGREREVEILVLRHQLKVLSRKAGRDSSNRSEDLTLAARNALLDMIDHTTSTFGYSRQQAYALCSVAVDLKISQVVDLKISQVVDLSNVLVSAFLPLGIFEQGVSGR